MIFAGCEKPEPEQPEEPGQEQPAPEVGKITLESDEELVFSDSGESHEVSFEATLDWTAAASEDFVTVKPTSGKAGEAKVTVTIGANESYDPRTATLTLTCGEDQKTIQITQKQKGALLLTQSDIYVAAEGGKVTVVAKANTNVTATVPDAAKNWITEVKTKGLVDYSFDFEVAANAITRVYRPKKGDAITIAEKHVNGTVSVGTVLEVKASSYQLQQKSLNCIQPFFLLNQQQHPILYLSHILPI